MIQLYDIEPYLMVCTEHVYISRRLHRVIFLLNARFVSLLFYNSIFKGC